MAWPPGYGGFPPGGAPPGYAPAPYGAPPGMYAPGPPNAWPPAAYPPPSNYAPPSTLPPTSGGMWPPGYANTSSPTSTGNQWTGATGAYNAAPPGYPPSGVGGGAYLASSNASFSSSGSSGYGSPYSTNSGPGQWPPGSSSPVPSHYHTQPVQPPPMANPPDVARTYSTPNMQPTYTQPMQPPLNYAGGSAVPPSGYPPGYPPNTSNGGSSSMYSPSNSGYGSSFGSGGSYANPFANPYSMQPNNSNGGSYANPSAPSGAYNNTMGSVASNAPTSQQFQPHPNTPVGPYGAPLFAVQANDAYSPKTGRVDNIGISPMQQMLMQEQQEEIARQEARKSAENEAAAKRAAQEALRRRESAEAQNQAFLYQIEMDRIQREAEEARNALEAQQRAALSAEEQKRKQILEKMAQETAEIERKNRAEQRRRAEQEEQRLKAEQEKLDQRQAALAAKERQVATEAQRAKQAEMDAQHKRAQDMAREAEEVEKIQKSFYASILDLTKILATTNQRIVKLVTLSYDDLASASASGGAEIGSDSDPRGFLSDLLAHLEKTSTRLVGMIQDNVMNVEDEIHSSMASSVQGMENSISSLSAFCRRLMNASSDKEFSAMGAEEIKNNAKNRSAAVSGAIKNVIDILAKMKIVEAASADGSTTKVLSAGSKEEAETNVERSIEAQSGERNRIQVQLGLTGKRPLNLAPFDPSSINLASYDEKKVRLLQRAIHHWATVMHFQKLVEAMTLANQNDKANAHRKKVLFEVLQTEASYFQTLDTIIEYFYKPFSGAAAKPGNGIITTAQVKTIFGSIQSIHAFSKDLLAKFDARLQKWPTVQLFGDIFLDHADEMMIYSDYVNGFDEATLELKKCLTNPKFVAYEQECIKATGKRLDLASLLIQPVQRMPRYGLLLKELISHSSTDHIDYRNLKEARTKVADVCATINKKKQEYDNKVMVARMTSEIIGLPFQLNPANSIFITSEFVQLEGDSKNWTRAFLFSDCVIFGKTKSDKSSGSPPPYTHLESFKLVDVGVVGRKGHKRSFLLWDKNKTGKKSERILHFAEELQASRWLKEMREATETASLQAMLQDDESANISVEPSRKGMLTLLCASYGDLSHPSAIIDVTVVLQKRIAEQGGKSLTLGASSKALLPGFVDPCKGKKKSLLLVYTYGGPPKTRTFMDESPVQITE